jgi:hypothetical protein
MGFGIIVHPEKPPRPNKTLAFKDISPYNNLQETTQNPLNNLQIYWLF